jgi:hypothetical protein
MEIELTADESAALQHALRSYSSDLRMEIVGTDNASYRNDLRAERTTLESVIDKLDEAAKKSSLRDANGRVVIRLVSIWATD